MENKDWRDEFDEQFRQGEQAWHPNFVLVVSFIDSLLKSKQEEIDGEIKKKRKIIFPLDTKPGMNLESITHLAEFNKKSMEYNQALQDIKETIDKLYSA